jgi:hypothetical protein
MYQIFLTFPRVVAFTFKDALTNTIGDDMPDTRHIHSLSDHHHRHPNSYRRCKYWHHFDAWDKHIWRL